MSLRSQHDRLLFQSSSKRSSLINDATSTDSLNGCCAIRADVLFSLVKRIVGT